MLIDACSVSKVLENNSSNIKKQIDEVSILDSVKKSNITMKSFFIQKIDIVITVLNERKRIQGSIRFENPDKYLISLRNNTGIEFSRIFVSKDTVLINDRINRRLYCGSINDFYLKYGIPAAVLPLIFGDLIGNELYNKETETIVNNEIIYNSVIPGFSLTYVIDCERNKTIEAKVVNDESGEKIELAYDKFIIEKGLILPGRIKILYIDKSATLEVRFKRIEFPWVGEVEFIPGRGYKVVQIL